MPLSLFSTPPAKTVRRLLTLATSLLILVGIGMDGAAQSGTHSETYYVSNRGDDANSGLSPNAPWRSLKRATRDPLPPGSTLLLERGSVFRETLRVPSSGEDGLPLTFAAYGEGERPIISGADAVSAWQTFGGEPDSMRLYRQLKGGGSDDAPFGQLRSTPASPRKGQIIPNNQALSVEELSVWLKTAGAPQGEVWAELWALNEQDLPERPLSQPSESVSITELSADTYSQVRFIFPERVAVPGEMFALVISGDYAPSARDHVVLDTRRREGERYRFPLVWENLNGADWTRRRDSQLRYEMIGRPQGVRFNTEVHGSELTSAPRRAWADQAELRRRPSPYDLEPGEYAYLFGRMFVRLPGDAHPDAADVTASQRRFAVHSAQPHDYITFRDVIAEKSNGNGKNDAVFVAQHESSYWVLENVTARYGAANGIFGERSLATGFGIGSHLLIRNSETHGHRFRGAVAAGNTRVGQVIDGLYSHDNQGDGLLINSRDGVLKNSLLENNGGQGGAPKHGVYIYPYNGGAENWDIFDNRFIGNRESGMRVAGKNHHIYNNVFDGSPFGMFVVDVDGVNEGHLIEDNTIKNTGARDFSLELEGAQDVTIRNNLFVSSPGIIIAEGYQLENSNITIENNRYEGTGAGDAFVAGCTTPGQGSERVDSSSRLRCY